MKNYLGFSYLSSFAAVGVAGCCVMPMVMILFGLGGSWLAIFGKIAALGPYVLTMSSAVIALAWLVAQRRGSLSRLKLWLVGSTVLTAVAWVVFLNEARINDLLMSWM